AGQFETFLGIAEPADLITAVRACWASHWSPRALRYMRACQVDPAQSAMPVLIQGMVEAEAAGGAFSLTPDDHIVLTGAWGLGPAVAQAEVVPDRYLVRRDTSVEAVEPGRKEHLVVSAGAGPCWRAVEPKRGEAAWLANTEASTLRALVLAAGFRRGSAPFRRCSAPVVRPGGSPKGPRSPSTASRASSAGSVEFLDQPKGSAKLGAPFALQ